MRDDEERHLKDMRAKREEVKRNKRRMRNPYEPIYDRKGLRKRHCTNCDQVSL